MGDIVQHFAWTTKRKKLIAGLKSALENMQKAGVKKVWIDGSFVQNKDEPDDIDGCREAHPNIDVSLLDSVFLDINPPREGMKMKYGVDFLISNVPFRDTKGENSTPDVFFQTDRQGNKKGIFLIFL